MLRNLHTTMFNHYSVEGSLAVAHWPSSPCLCNVGTLWVPVQSAESENICVVQMTSFFPLHVYQAQKVGSPCTLRLTQISFKMKISSRSSMNVLRLPCNPTIQHRMLGVGQRSLSTTKSHKLYCLLPPLCPRMTQITKPFNRSTMFTLCLPHSLKTLFGWPDEFLFSSLDIYSDCSPLPQQVHIYGYPALFYSPCAAAAGCHAWHASLP